MRLTLKLLMKHKLYEGLIKCDFYGDIIPYLGHIISVIGISKDPERNEAIWSCLASRKLIDVIYFVGLVGYCRKFTEGSLVDK